MSEEMNRHLAQFFFEVGYAACWADAFVKNDETPPFKITDALFERAWKIAPEAHEDPEEWDRHKALADAAPDLLEACQLALGAFEHNHCIDWAILSAAIAKATSNA